MMVDYPETFPLDEVKSIIDNIRNNTARQNIKDFAHDVWVVQGFAQKSIIGDISDFSVSVQSLEEESGLDLLVKAAAQAESSTVTPQSVIPWELILQWLLKELLKNLSE